MRCLNCMNTFREEYGVCPYCGYIQDQQPKAAFHLMPGTVLQNRYVIGTTVGTGGFGITYRAWDESLDKQVAMKEYFPNGVVNRVPGNPEVIVFSDEATGEFERGRIRFLAEAENMAKFNSHPNIVDVYNFFEENHTAYIVMEFLDGLSFKNFLSLYGEKIPYEKAVDVVIPVLKALKEIHRKKIVHRDISPDNVYILPLDTKLEHYQVKVIDFGAARLSDGEEEKTLSIILKPGFAPPEQYEKKSKQGPWTDFYAVGAMLYLAVTGIKPDESLNRVLKDELVPPGKVVPQIPKYLNDTIMRAMALNPQLRFRNADQFLEALNQKAKVRTVEEQRLLCRLIRGITIVGLCLMTGGIGFFCFSVYSYRQTMLYQVEAELSVQMAGTNENNMEIIRQAENIGRIGTKEERKISRQDSEDMLEEMLEEYRDSFQKVEIGQTEILDSVSYKQKLKVKAEQGKLPDVFESTGVTSQDTEIWNELGSLLGAFDSLDKRDYYFMGDKEFDEHFGREKKQMPVSFCAPVLYVNTYLVPETKGLEAVTSLEQLKVDGNPSYCVSVKDQKMYQEAFEAKVFDPAFASAAEGDNRAAGLDGKDGYGISASAKEGSQKGYEPFLRREKAFYLGTTDDYEAIRASLGGIYQMVVLTELQEEGKVKGRFTHLWSIRGSLEKDARTAADHMVYYLLGERVQDIFNVQNGNGLSLNRRIMEVYVKNNDEFQPVMDELENLKMEYENLP